MVKSTVTNVAARRPKQAKQTCFGRPRSSNFRSLLPPIDGMTLPAIYEAPIMMKRRPPHGLSKAELRAAGQHAVAQSSKPIVKLPTKLVRQCGRCGEFGSVMVEPGQPAPEFKCKTCDRP
jgi:hypothetical protein